MSDNRNLKTNTTMPGENERLRHFVESSRDVLWTADENLVFTWISPAVTSVLGWAPELVIGRSLYEFVPPESTAVVDALVRRRQEMSDVMEGSSLTFRTDLQIYNTQHRPIWLDVTTHPIRNDSGVFVGIYGIARDATERHRADQALAAANRFLHGALDALIAHVCVVDSEGIIIAVNAAWRGFMRENGLDPEAASRGNYFDAIHAGNGGAHGEDRVVLENLRAVGRGQADRFLVEYPCRVGDKARWFRLTATSFDGDGSRCVLITHEDTTSLHPE